MSTTILSPIVKLSKDLAKAAKMLSRDEARFLVDSYYQLQEIRKATTNQIGSIARAAAGLVAGADSWDRNTDQEGVGELC